MGLSPVIEAGEAEDGPAPRTSQAASDPGAAVKGVRDPESERRRRVRRQPAAGAARGRQAVVKKPQAASSYGGITAAMVISY